MPIHTHHHRSDVSTYRALRDRAHDAGNRHDERRARERLASFTAANPGVRDRFHRDEHARRLIDKAADSLDREQMWRSHRANFLDANGIKDSNLDSINDSSASITRMTTRLSWLRRAHRAYVHGDINGNQLAHGPLRPGVTPETLSPLETRFLTSRIDRLNRGLDADPRYGLAGAADARGHIRIVDSSRTSAQDEIDRLAALGGTASANAGGATHHHHHHPHHHRPRP